MRVKLFWNNDPMGPWKSGFLRVKPTASNAQDFENQINAWLRENPSIRVVDIKQTASGGSYAVSLWLISVWYEEGA
jgi:hypothetical protein